MAVGIGRTAALLTVAVAVILVAATQVATAACRAVVAAAPIAGEAELQCVRRCTTEMLACAAASGCASATVWRRRRGAVRRRWVRERVPWLHRRLLMTPLLCYPFLSRFYVAKNC